MLQTHMVELIGNALWGLLLAAIGVAFIVGARTLAEIGRGITYPPTRFGSRPEERPIGWRILLSFRWFGFTLVCADIAVVVWAFSRSDAIDDCLDAGGRWIESELVCEGVR
jgi:hypothetical protein